MPVPGDHPQSMGASIEGETSARGLEAMRRLLASHARR
jgi:hypothetical protein